eukprot:2322980-Ditylum_brightwellii.AAC.1
MTGLCESVDHDEDGSPTTLTNCLSTGGSRTTWAASKVEMDGNVEYITAAIQDGSAIVSAAACIIKGATPNKHPITATSTTPGPLEIQDAYWAELSVACDGLEVIRKAMADDTTFFCQSNQFDLISAIDSMIDKSPLVWKWRWVKGHRDEKKKGDKWKGCVKKFIGPLDRWTMLNVAMDSAAKRT